MQSENCTKRPSASGRCQGLQGLPGFRGEEKKHEEAWMAGPQAGDRVIYQIYQQRLYIELWKENEIEGNIRSKSTLEMSFVPRLLNARLACVGDQDKNCLRGNP